MANVTYKVVKGDTLSGIAKAKNTTVDALLALNPDIVDRNRIYVGQVIIISGTAAPKTQNKSQKPKINNFGLQSDTQRTIYATWVWDKPNTDHYEVKWIYSTGDGVGFIGEKSNTTNKQALYYAPENANHVAFYVRPISKTYKQKDKDVNYWTAEWSTVKRYYFVDDPGIPPKAEAANITIKDYKLTIALNNLASLKADSIQFQIVRDNGSVYKNGTAKIANNKVSYSCTLEDGKQYIVKSRSIKGTLKSEWSAESDIIFTTPAASDGIYLIYALSSTAVSINWYEVSGVDKYEIQYTTDKRNFDSSSGAVKSDEVNASEAGHIDIYGLDTGKEWFFRVRTVKGGKNGSWTAIKSIALGSTPTAPTTWSSTTTAKVGEQVFLYWVHNSQDGSRQTKTMLEITINGNTKTKTIHYGNCNTTDDITTKKISVYDFDSEDLVEDAVVRAYMAYTNTHSEIKLSINDTTAVDILPGEFSSLYWAAGSMITFTYKNSKWVLTEINTQGNTERYVLDTSTYTSGATVQWSVKTSGILKDPDTNKYIYGEPSVQRTIDIYPPPVISVNVTDHTGDTIEELVAYPFNVVLNSGPNTQTPISYFVSIVSNEPYEDIDEVGNTIRVNEGTEVFYKKLSSPSRQETVPITAGDINLKNNISYKVIATVAMDSGLTAETSEEFTVSIEDSEYWPNAEIIYDPDSYTTSIRAYCETDAGDLIENILLSVYRRESDGSFTKLNDGDIINTERTYITDPHPSLDFARYRVVARDSSSGNISYYDVPGYPIGETAVIIQWDEKWHDYDLTDDVSYEVNGITYVDELDKPSWSGSLIRLPYNIDISEDNQVDVSLINYIGRQHPVSYYGTQLGVTQSWSMVIPKNDKRTLYALRRLSRWTGDVYVREPSGNGYWASIAVSFSQTHNDLTIPITINITRVEGGK